MSEKPDFSRTLGRVAFEVYSKSLLDSGCDVGSWWEQSREDVEAWEAAANELEKECALRSQHNL